MNARTDGSILQNSAREIRARTIVKCGALATVIGIALAVSGDNGIARFITLFGVVSLVIGLHRFGRLGSDGARGDAE